VDALTGLMLPDGVWHRQGAALSGAEAVAAALARRSPIMRIHHLLTNAFAMCARREGAEVTPYMMMVRHEPGRPLDGPAALENIRTVRATRRRAGASLRCGATRLASPRNKNKTEDTPCVG
jgi:hypothetical protein